MKEIQNLLKILSEGLKMVAQGIEAVSGKVDEITKSQAAEEPKPPAKARAKKSAPAAPKKKPVKKTAAKEPKKKAAKAQTAAETVYNVISRSKKGVDNAILMKKTGFDRKKVANMLYRLGQQGKIKTVEKGVYVKA